MLLSSEHISKLASILVRHSTKVQPGERVVIEGIDVAPQVLMKVAKEVQSVGGYPIVQMKSAALMSEIGNLQRVEDLQILAESELTLMKEAHCFIGLRAVENLYESAEMNPETRERILSHFVRPVHYEFRNHNMRWVYTRIPTKSSAQIAQMSSELFASYFLDALTVDYVQLRERMHPLKQRLERAESVRVTHPNGTNLSFTLDNLGTYISDGRKNLPDGEIFTAPVKESVSGTLITNIPSTYYGKHFHEIELKFETGKVVDARSGDMTIPLNEILDTDKGARYIGEFAFGTNPMVTTPIGDILFDEKMLGSVHFALGNAYPVADNGNRSAIHWDIILSQKAKDGGGQVWLDEELISDQGVFLPSDLQALNNHSFTPFNPTR